ncbi:hypothetical protein N0V82_009631 [Gnomoniopsis sp. IMI 355080]|nr:hypothetical protein N0V82_009631 [Gnomoniopsis sp. IMI 355080]
MATVRMPPSYMSVHWFEGIWREYSWGHNTGPCMPFPVYLELLLVLQRGRRAYLDSGLDEVLAGPSKDPQDDPFLYAIDGFNSTIGLELEEEKDKWLRSAWDVGLFALANNGGEANGNATNGGDAAASSSRDGEMTDLGLRMANTTLNEAGGEQQVEEQQVEEQQRMVEGQDDRNTDMDV